MRVEGTDFVRDTHNNALINTNVSAFILYKQQRNTLIAQSAQEIEILNLKNELTQMKNLLQELIRDKNG